ncbi:ROK family protein [uncultured Jatrophihabitans sp.]|uniref:ROK family transcriptional regulator n=1 Tax=uncultured Jatrophihabitans sp. TaxID=1610747 RepID=UPI0035C9AA32
MTSQSGSLTALRRHNRVQVLDMLRRRGTTSRTEIARRTGLSTTTVSTLVGELMAEGVVVELDDRTVSRGGGRPARVLAFNPAAGGAVGLHLAHDHVRVGVTDLAGRIVAENAFEIDVDHEPGKTLELAADLTHELVVQAGISVDGVVGMGVAVSAPVFATTHALGSHSILADWLGVDVAAELTRRTGLHVEIGNDANLGAIAEHRFGVAQDVDDFVYVMLSDGVGAGLVLGGRLYEGAIGGAGEIGHVTVVPGGYVCRCGSRGCLETVAGAPALTSAFALTGEPAATLGGIVAADRAGDDGTRRVLTDAGAAVGRALVPICTVLDPALVVVGGECSASETLIAAVQRALAGGITPLRTGTIPVRAGALGEKAEMLGAVALASQRMPMS